VRNLLVVPALLLVGCLTSTPFQGETSETNLTAKQLKKLVAGGEPPEAWSFLAFGDTHDEYDELARAVETMNQTDARLALIAGDLADRGTLQEFEWSAAQYLKLQIPFVTAIGNHDQLSGGVRVYEQMYGPRDYTFEYGGLKFVVFDSNTLENPQAPRRDWLTAQVKDHGDAKVVLLTHQSPLSPDDVEGGTNREFYDELLRSGDVALVVNGHLDEFQLSSVHGVPVLQCGTFQTQFLYTRILFDGEAFRFEACEFEDCEAREPQAAAEAE